MGRTFESLPSISLVLTSHGASRVRKVSSKRISSDPFTLLQTGSMDLSRDPEHDRIHLRDLLTCSARSLVSPVRGSESGGVFRPPKIPKRGRQFGKGNGINWGTDGTFPQSCPRNWGSFRLSPVFPVSYGTLSPRSSAKSRPHISTRSDLSVLQPVFSLTTRSRSDNLLQYILS